MNNSITRSKGVTLIELLFTLAIVGILASVAIPSFSDQLKQDRLISNANQLQSVFKFARSEAAKRNETILLNENAGEWEVIINPGAANERILQKFSATNSNISVTRLADLTITATGEIPGAPAANAGYLITDNDSATTDYCLSVLVSGQSALNQTNAC